MIDKAINAKRFSGFADTYDSARPRLPAAAAELLYSYLERKPDLVLDLGCGTGLSTLIWQGVSQKTIGIEPGKDMFQQALSKSSPAISFMNAYSDNIALPDQCADIIVCSQSFHWMEPFSTLKESNRLLKSGGIFACVDYDWPPITKWQVEKAYAVLMEKVNFLEQKNPSLQATFIRFPKSQHLKNIIASGYFTYTREVLFSSTETCTKKRILQMAYSQSGLQNVLKTMPKAIEDELKYFIQTVEESYSDEPFTISFSYRMRMGIKE